MIFISETFNEVEKRSYSVESKDSPTDLTKFELKGPLVNIFFKINICHSDV